MVVTATNAYPDGISRQQLYTAFGTRGIPQLVQQLNIQNPIGIREHAINVLAHKMHRPEDLDSALSAGILAQIKTILEQSNKDNLFLKTKALEITTSIAGNAFGRSGLITSNVMGEIYKLLDDQNDESRQQVYEIFLIITGGLQIERGDSKFSPAAAERPQPSHKHSCAKIIVNDFPEFFSKILAKLPNATLDEQAILLGIVANLLPASTHSGQIYVKTMKILKQLIVPDQASMVLATACSALTAMNRLSVNSDEWVETFNTDFQGQSKTVACVANEQGITTQLLKFLGRATDFKLTKKTDATLLLAKSFVVLSAINALMAIATDVEAKKTIFQEHGVEMLQAILERSVKVLFAKKTDQRVVVQTSEVSAETDLEKKLLLSTMQALGCTAEEHRARSLLQLSLPHLKTVVEQSRDQNEVMTAMQTIKVVTWTP